MHVRYLVVCTCGILFYSGFIGGGHVRYSS